MIYRKYSKDSGFMIIDVMLGFTISVLFIALITDVSLGARTVVEKAKIRNQLLDMYESHTDQVIEAHPYGNDFIEKRISIDDLTFIELISAGIFPENSSPVCVPDFSNKNVVGSYGYLQGLGAGRVPQMVVTKIDLPLSVSFPITHFEVHNNLAYVSIDSNIAADPDIAVFDIGSSTLARLLSSINTGPGIASFTVAGRRIYAAAASTAAQLHIIYINNPDQALGGLTLEKKYQLALPYATATPAMGSSIFFNDGTVYLGTDRWDGEELSVIDVHMPSMPFRLGGFETGGKVNDILVPDSTAFVASSDEQQFRILDVHDLAHPALISSLNPSGWQRQEGKTLSFFEGQLFGGRTSGGFNIVRDPELFNLSTYNSADVAGGIYGIVPDRSYLFTASRALGRELQVYDRNLSTTTMNIFPLPDIPESITCDGNNLYVLAHGFPTLYKISFIK